MKVLLTTSTVMECVEFARFSSSVPVPGISHPLKTELKNIELDLLVTGIGMVNTALQLGKYFGKEKPAFAIHFGVAGSFTQTIAIGSVVELVEEHFWKMGAEDHENFIDIEKMGFPLFESSGNPTYSTLLNPYPSSFDLHKAQGITSNLVHGNAISIQEIIQNRNPDVETMESAAFFQACLIENVPFWSFRGISNFVEPRNRANWKLKEAAKNVQDFVMDALASINSDK